MKTYEFEYLSEVKLRDRRSTNCFMSAIELKAGEVVRIERENRGIFLGRIMGVYECECNTDYMYIGKAGEVVAAYIDAVDKEKRKEELRAQMEAKFKGIDEERKFEYYATLDDSFRELYNEYRELC